VSIRAAFVYANPRTALAQDVAAGLAPDTGLLGQNHLAPLGIDATVYDPLLTRRRVLPFRVAWNLRELTLPWELRGTDVVCTPLANLLPLAARGARTTRAVVVNMGLCARIARSGRAQRRLVRTSLGSAAAVVCFASAQRDRLLEQTGLPEDRVRAVLFGVDDQFYAPSPPVTDGYVLAAGRDLARDYGTFARAVDGLDAKAVLVASARNLTGVSLPSNVRVQLDLSYGELRRLYAGASCVVIPTRSDAYPYGADCSGHTVLLEAMAAGRPTVLSSRATNAEYLEGPDPAIEVPPEDPAALRDAIEQVLSDDRRAAAMGSAGRTAVEQRFTTRHLAERLAPILREAAEG
jgi:glycosyltransferase involved in cell wall biosynthesis